MKNISRDSRGRFYSFVNASKRIVKKIVKTSAFITVGGWLIYGGITYEKMTAKPTVVKAEVKVEVPVDSPSPVMDRIAKCESGSQQFAKSGQVLIHVNSDGSYDQGFFQVNSVWNAQATKLGYNLALEKDNRAFGMWLYKNYGTEPWYSSKTSCWSK